MVLEFSKFAVNNSPSTLSFLSYPLESDENAVLSERLRKRTATLTLLLTLTLTLIGGSSIR